VVYGKPAKGRKQRNRRGQPARTQRSLQNADREREPWLLVASPELVDLNAGQRVALYARRMQIELSFRDLKSHRYGNAFEDSLTRKGPRIAILLLIHAMAAFASWLVGLACEAADIQHWLSARRSKRRLYSIWRIGREALLRGWPCGTLSELLDRLRQPNAASLDQLRAGT
jgi:Transposase DDE domain